MWPYKDDFNPQAGDKGSVVENLHIDIMAQSKIKPGGSLAVKLGLDRSRRPPRRS